MDSPRFSVGRELAEFIAASGILHKAWEEIDNVSKRNDSFLLNKYEGVVYVSFPSWDMEDIMVKEGRYGACNIQSQNRVFSPCLSGYDEKPVLVHKGALIRFINILENSDFKEKVQRLRKQTVIFVGHSIGGAVATLATLWCLGERVKSSCFCVTFGSSLVGNGALGKAIERENWSRIFLHVVSKYDIVPRVLLAPLVSIADPLDAIIPHWETKMGMDDDGEHPISEACKTLLHNVTECISQIENNYPGESCRQSPYRPFGTFMFCSNQGAACIENSEAVMKMLHFTMESREGMSTEHIAEACISDHTGYGDMVKDIIQVMLNSPKSVDFLNDSETGIALELEVMGIGSQNVHALRALKTAGQQKNEKDINIEKLDLSLSKSQSYMAEVEWYKRRRSYGWGYYSSFKTDDDKYTFNLHLARLKISLFWDEIVDMEEKHVLPSDFRLRNKWIYAGTTYRRLVEPLDIADHYRRRRDNKSYLSEGMRPHRHIVLEKWLSEKDKTHISRDKKKRTRFASLTEDSCFWARVEEASKEVCKALESPSMTAALKESREFENYVWSMIQKRSISADVFLEESLFMIWWAMYRDLQLQFPEWTSRSDLFDFMTNERWK